MPEIYTFWDLHVAIQDAMGWDDSHLHEFDMRHPKTGDKVKIVTSDEDIGFFMKKAIPEREVKIANWFSIENSNADYIYDFGDSWRHKIKLEKILPREKNIAYPVCIAGKRACPPEDCGGIWGYEELLEIINDPEHEEHEEMLEWVGKDFDPEYFNPEAVRFCDPDKHSIFPF